MQAHKEKQLEYNLGVLRRRDAQITKLLNMSAHVVLYQFNEETQIWDLKKCEGSMFVVARATEPRHMFVVLNRLSNDNVVEGITADFKLELTDQFLLYRNERQEIIGIWFYSTTERAEIASLLESLVKGDEPGTSVGVSEGVSEGPAATDAVAASTASTATASAPTATASAGSAATSAGEEPHAQPPPEPATASNVAEFFSMLQSQLPAAAAASLPPMPTGATDASATLPSAAHDPRPPAEATPTSLSQQPVSSTSVLQETVAATSTSEEHAVLKRQLRTRLAAMLDDDAFMEILAAEYLQLRAPPPGGDAPPPPPQHGQAQAQAQAHTEGTVRESATSSQVPDHLMMLLQQNLSVN